MDSKARNPNKKLKKDLYKESENREWVEIYQELNESQNENDKPGKSKLNVKRTHSGKGVAEREEIEENKMETKLSSNQRFEEKSLERDFFSKETTSEEESEEFKKKVSKNEILLLKESKKFSFGNYDKYYNYRFEERWRDPRVTRFRKEYFLNKDCLDIGCNDGSITIMIAIKYFPRKILGIDIDYTLINKCVSNLRYFEKQQSLCKPRREEKQEEIIVPLGGDAVININKPSQDGRVKYLLEKLRELPKSFEVSMGLPSSFLRSGLDSKMSLINSNNMINEMETENIDIEGGDNKQLETEIDNSEGDSDNIKHVSNNCEPAPCQSQKENSEGTLRKIRPPSALVIENRFPNNISFRTENFIKESENVDKFDTIMCLSVTKWIHLNWGDTGIKKLFKKIHDSLRDDGILILEPQDWSSYKKKKCLCEEFKQTYRKIKLKPKDFEDYLKIRLGFTLLEKMTPDLNDTKGGFKRTMYVFQKARKEAKVTGDKGSF